MRRRIKMPLMITTGIIVGMINAILAPIVLFLLYILLASTPTIFYEIYGEDEWQFMHSKEEISEIRIVQIEEDIWGDLDINNDLITVNYRKNSI